MKVLCTRNDSKSLPFSVNGLYSVDRVHGGGLYDIVTFDGSKIQAPLQGHYLDFIVVEDIQ
ncbi:hypothetical protein [Gibbsiella quercinecans]|uniref:DUF7244 family protein n=1 Tax=Gibbsiella quercinecans TaxID=929813 RepID=UPI0024332BC1|nr:hypothetical protein [Gibbsiella quercinecans]